MVVTLPIGCPGCRCAARGDESAVSVRSVETRRTLIMGVESGDRTEAAELRLNITDRRRWRAGSSLASRAERWRARRQLDIELVRALPAVADAKRPHQD